MLGRHYEPSQVATLRALERHRRVYVRSRRKGGKTFAAADAVLWFFATRRSKTLTTAAGGRQVRELLWAELRTAHAHARLPGESGTTTLRLGPDHFAIGFSTDNPANVLGWHGTAECPLLVVIDEAPGVDQSLWDALQGSITSEHVYVLVQGNPILEESDPHFFARLAQHGSGYHRIRIGYEDDSDSNADEVFLTPFGCGHEWPKERAREWDRESPLYRAHVEGMFAAAGSLGLYVISRSLLEQAIGSTSKQGRHLGVDVSRLGADETVAALWVDGVKTDVRTWRGIDLMTTAQEIAGLARTWDVRPECVHVDATGLGAGVVDRLRQVGLACDSVDFGAAPIGDWPQLMGETRPKNRRAELHWVYRRAFQERLGHIPARFVESWNEALWPRYVLKAEGSSGTVLQIEPKDDIKARHGRSPDHLDADLLAWSRAGNRLPLFGIPGKRPR